MGDTPLEQLMKQVVVACRIKAGERRHNTLKREFGGQQVSYPWFCAKDSELKSFLEDWTFYYDWQHKNMRVQYVVKLLFSAEAVHEPGKCTSVYNSCPHTIGAVCDFLSKEFPVQETVIDRLIENDWYSDRLIFLLNNSQSEIVFECSSAPPVTVKEDGSFQKLDNSMFYTTASYENLKMLPAHTKYTLGKIDELCKRGFSRNDLVKRDEFRVLVKEAIQQKSPHGT